MSDPPLPILEAAKTISPSLPPLTLNIVLSILEGFGDSFAYVTSCHKHEMGEMVVHLQTVSWKEQQRVGKKSTFSAALLESTSLTASHRLIPCPPPLTGCSGWPV